MEKINNFFALQFDYSHYVVVMILISMGLMVIAIPSRLLKFRRLSALICLSVAIINIFALIPLSVNFDVTNSFLSKIIAVIVLVIMAFIIRAQGRLEIPLNIKFKRAVFIADAMFPLLYIFVSCLTIFAIITNN